MFLQHFKNDVEILYYKDPSFIKKVKYSDIVKKLYDTQISDKEEEDKCLKKLVANVNCGLLEKGVNKAQKYAVFDTFEEAKHYQAEYGGKISIVRKYEEILEQIEDPLDFGLDNPNMVINKKSY